MRGALSVVCRPGEGELGCEPPDGQGTASHMDHATLLLSKNKRAHQLSYFCLKCHFSFRVLNEHTVKLILPWVYGSLDILKNIYLFGYAWSLLQHVGSSSLTRLPPTLGAWSLSHRITRKSPSSGFEYQDRFE